MDGEYILQIKIRFLDKCHLNKKFFKKLGNSELVPKLLDNIEENNIDKVLANRFEKRGMRWSRKGARNLAKIIIADRNNTLEKHLNKISWEFKTDDLRKAYNNV
ncbi:MULTISPECIES: hypothetical protein [Halanaerobium]|jgi:hypothetical protein|uniref:Uncharacterized protein n=1 Tax=Halanaerobium congolense TaxID=54121 RepID=A0A4V3GW73_9FIRM|nr:MULTISPECIES: hypothetical protein [Halanaerobium]PUU89077.1 MAG: hypothetical protein CI949_2860 [Halanaerobium sp.]TDX42899.1 hypothetical protein C7954_11910 [Halanaerobium congolense]SDK72634.1 hypothetical protein SAMN04515655_11314 [Halanaerobium congolense]SDL85803.1 hypothetical protein SAMN04488599_101165 [Halanaerobium congolense]